MKTKKSNKINNQWVQISGEKEIKKFQSILDFLNNHYMKFATGELSESQKFRNMVAAENYKNLEIFLKRFNKYEYLIFVMIDQNAGQFDPKIKDAWIHIDGVEEQRDEMREAKNFIHVSFEIPNMTDLWEKSEPAPDPNPEWNK